MRTEGIEGEKKWEQRKVGVYAFEGLHDDAGCAGRGRGAVDLDSG